MMTKSKTLIKNSTSLLQEIMDILVFIFIIITPPWWVIIKIINPNLGGLFRGSF